MYVNLGGNRENICIISGGKTFLSNMETLKLQKDIETSLTSEKIKNYLDYIHHKLNQKIRTGWGKILTIHEKRILSLTYK